MGEVIHVDFSKRSKTIPNPLWLRFVDMMVRNGMCEDDILDVTDAIASITAYEAADDDIKQIADVWLRNV